jgi:hypothetical protein
MRCAASNISEKMSAHWLAIEVGSIAGCSDASKLCANRTIRSKTLSIGRRYRLSANSRANLQVLRERRQKKPKARSVPSSVGARPCCHTLIILMSSMPTKLTRAL